MSVWRDRSVRPVVRGVRRVRNAGAVLVALCIPAFAQEPTGVVTGSVTDPCGATVAKAIVRITAVATSKSEQVNPPEGGSFTFAALPAGTYELRVTADGFQTFVTPNIKVEINRTVRVPVQLVLGGYDVVEVNAAAQRVETGSTSLGETVSEREIVDLPLNGLNFTQLGLLQAGVAPMTSGLMVAGGPIKATQAFAVNGQRPESNNYLLDGVRNLDRMDGGYAIKTPVD